MSKRTVITFSVLASTMFVVAFMGLTTTATPCIELHEKYIGGTDCDVYGCSASYMVVGSLWRCCKESVAEGYNSCNENWGYSASYKIMSSPSCNNLSSSNICILWDSTACSSYTTSASAGFSDFAEDDTVGGGYCP